MLCCQSQWAGSRRRHAERGWSSKDAHSQGAALLRRKRKRHGTPSETPITSSNSGRFSMPANTRARLIFSDKHVLKPIFGESGKLRRLLPKGQKKARNFFG